MRMTPHQILLAFLYFIILLVLLPIFSSNKVHSAYYQEKDKKEIKYIEKLKNDYRKDKVTEYLRITNQVESLQYHESNFKNNVDNLIIIIAKSPKDKEALILSQLAAEIDLSLREKDFLTSALVICNASRKDFNELEHLAEYYPVFQAYNTTQWKLFNSEEIIKHDFVECIGHAINHTSAKYITVIRDVILPYSNFLPALTHIIRTKLSRSFSQGELVESPSWLYMHLHEPLTFRHFDLTIVCIVELFLITCIGALLFYFTFRLIDPNLPHSYRVTYCFYGALYFFTFSLVIGRPYINELRRLSYALYRVYDPPEPVHFSAMTLPSKNAAALRMHLTGIMCSSYVPFHEVLDHFVNTMELPAFVVSPSLFRYVVDES
ncbi:unnamed protein product [Meganyctiphanes norvegica]|uniref:Odorant receptor n=1 Tax=Meganyctiphanes norvegica TaxID=48144 RepID=A0AAV2R8D5_MEGNR